MPRHEHQIARGKGPIAGAKIRAEGARQRAREAVREADRPEAWSFAWKAMAALRSRHRRSGNVSTAAIPTRRDERALSPDYINAIASKLEHNTTRQAATSSRNPSDTKSSSPMVHLPLAMLRPNLLKISESALLRFGCIRTRRGEGGGSPRRPLRGLQNANEKRTAVLRPCCVD